MASYAAAKALLFERSRCAWRNQLAKRFAAQLQTTLHGQGNDLQP